MIDNEIQASESAAMRRDFLASAARTALAMSSVGLLATVSQAATRELNYHSIPYPRILNLPGLKAGDDIHVLNYALALEDLESDLYLQAVMRLTTGGVNAIGRTIPGLGVSEDEPDVAYVMQFAPVEAEHRDFLRGALNGLINGLAIAPKRYDFGIESKGREDVLELVRVVEATGVAAYLGAVPYLKTKLFVTAAAAILGTEARHTAVITAIQNSLYNGSSPKPVAPPASDNHGIDTPMDPDTVLAQVAPFIV